MTTISFEGDSISDLSCGLSREWLVTNGIGGYASGTVAQLATRRYHALLVSAVQPPVQRMAQLVRLGVVVHIDGQAHDLSSAQYQDGTVFPQGYQLLRSFAMEDGVPTWSYVIDAFMLRVRLWMVPERNITVLRFKLAAGNRSAELALRPLVAARDHHGLQRASGAHQPSVEPITDGIRVQMQPESPPLWLLARGMDFNPGGDWYWNFLLPVERERGYDHLEDLYQPGTFRVSLRPGESATLIASADDPESGLPDVDAAQVAGRNQAAHAARQATTVVGQRDARLTELAAALRLASLQFVVRRGAGEPPDPKVSILAGYHWFADWGRDAMIPLPGLLLARGDVERSIALLRAYLDACSEGMVPNRFPDSGASPEYNTADATLWLFQSLKQTLEAMDPASAEVLLRELFPGLEDIVDWHQRGTRYGIRVDPADGLLHAGEAGDDETPPTQLTWMDARIGRVVLTPRVGKPVEVNALWIGALELMATWSTLLGRPGHAYAEAALRARSSFKQRFWYDEGGYLFDVLDGPGGDDPSIRPNQVMALALHPDLLERAQARSAFEVVTRHLLTPYGLRTLSPEDPRYRGQCVGDQPSRDSAYHQGTVWPWLLGPYADAFRYLYPERCDDLAELLFPFIDHLRDAGVGTVSEIFDGDAPHTPRGCIAQAWSVAELLRILTPLCS